jgi:MFS family permease
VKFLGGDLADMYGRRRLLISMCFGVARSNLVFGFAPSWEIVVIAVLIQNLCLIHEPAIAAITADSMPEEKRGLGFSLIMFLANLASLASPLVAGTLFLYFGTLEGVRIGFLIVTAFYLAAAIVRIRVKETISSSGLRLSLTGLFKAYPQALKESFGVWRVLPRSMFVLFLINIIGSFSYTLIGSYLVLYTTQISGIEEYEWAILMTWLTAVMIIGALPSGKLVDKYGRAKCLLISWLIYVPFPLMVLWEDLTIIYIGFLLWGISNALFMPGYLAIEADLVPKELRGKEIGCNQFVTYLLMAAGGLVGGFLYENTTPSLPFILSFILAAFCLLLQAMFIREPTIRQ